MLAEIVNWKDLGLAGLLSLVVLMILIGRLVPWRYYDEARRERDVNREAAQTAIQASVEQGKSVEKLAASVAEMTAALREVLAIAPALRELLAAMKEKERHAATPPPPSPTGDRVEQ